MVLLFAELWLPPGDNKIGTSSSSPTPFHLLSVEMAFLHHIAVVVFLPMVAFSFSTIRSIGPLSADFQTYLSSRNLDSHYFARIDYGSNGSFGGREHSDDVVSRTPVIFIHGNSDSALWTNEFSTGWDTSVKIFLQNGYKMRELYGTSWATTEAAQAIYRYHSCSEVGRLRAFVEAVLDYTGSSQVSVVAHSMGVTLLRKAIQGGRIYEPNGDECQLGPSLAPRVDVFVGISSANAGLCWCAGAGHPFPTCNAFNGFFVSPECGEEPAASCSHHFCSAQRSNLLTDLRAKDGQRVYSIWSTTDELIGGGGLVWGVQTSLVPGSDGAEILTGPSHMETKEVSAGIQLRMVSGAY